MTAHINLNRTMHLPLSRHYKAWSCMDNSKIDWDRGEKVEATLYFVKNLNSSFTQVSHEGNDWAQYVRFLHGYEKTWHNNEHT
jgi:hypothetical protein